MLIDVTRYSTHIRDENDLLEEAVDEAILIGNKAHVPVVISHHKCMKKHTGKASV
jgi:N-acyl-D-amino-acid deacylase